MSMDERIKATKAELDSVSPSLCLAKWLQVTLHLHSGQNHSCHHPKVHKIPLDELKSSPSALHNTLFKKEQRNKMLNGERPEECGYCWNIENLGSDFVSDRILKSSEGWARPYFKEVVQNHVSADINPRYVEVSFSNSCNFKCSYCSADFSTKWKEELKTFGPYSTRSGEASTESISEEENPYVKAFWNWWPNLKKDLKTFRLTGGEPLLSPSTFKVLEMINTEPLPEMQFAVNSNLGVSRSLVEKFVEYAKPILRDKKVSDFKLFTSVEAFAEKAEYIRHGLKFDHFWSNLNYILSELPELQIVFMMTFNALSVTSFQHLLEETLKMRLQYQNPHRLIPIVVDVSYLRHPLYQSVQVLTEDYWPKMQKIVQFVEDNKFNLETKKNGFHVHEVLKIQRTYEWMRTPLAPEDLRSRRIDFYSFFSEHDRRRSVDFLKCFPEMREFWEICKNS